ncbi:hypothetical protein DV737_g5707, partial [Chaetothyriales sp. CBS 132003]
MANAAMEDYNDTNRAFLQAMLARNTLTLDTAKPLLADIFSVQEGREVRNEDVTLDDLTSYIAAANAALSPFNYEIRNTLHQRTRERVWALVNTTSDALTQLATSYTADEMAYVKRLLDAMFDGPANRGRMEAMCLSTMDAVQLSRGNRPDTQNGATQPSSHNLTIKEAEDMLAKLMDQGWLEKSGAGFYSLTPRALMELKGWLVDTYNDAGDDEGGDGRADKIKFCHAVNDALSVNVFVDYTISTEWKGESYVGEKAITTSKSYQHGRRRGKNVQSEAEQETDDQGTANDGDSAKCESECNITNLVVLLTPQIDIERPPTRMWTSRNLLRTGAIAVVLAAALYSQVAQPSSQKVYARATQDSNIYDTRFDGVTFDLDTWRLKTTRLDQGRYQSRASVSNGYIGINVAALGPFFEVDTAVDGDLINGWPDFQRRQTFATVGGFWTSQPTTNSSNYAWLYQYGWDTAIAGLPHWAGIVVDLGGSTFLDASTSNSTISNFESTLDMKRNVLSWSFTWAPEDHGSFNVSYELFAHRLNINQGFVQVNITSGRDANVTIANVLNGDCAVRTTPGTNGAEQGFIYTSVQPRGVDNVTAFVFANITASGAKVRKTKPESLNRQYIGNNQSSIADGFDVALAAGKTASFTKYVGIASSDGFAKPREVAKNAALSARHTGYECSLASHVAEWADLFRATSVDDYSFAENGSLPADPYIVEAAIVAIANPYHILQNTLTEKAVQAALSSSAINAHSIAVGGLGSDSYAGQIFWDAETWMQPGLVSTFPYAASGIANYRTARYRQAQANIDTAYQSSKNKTDFTSSAAIYPWTSGRYGNCTATGPCWDYEYHINGDIAHSFANYWTASGDTDYFRDSLFPIHTSIASLYSQLLEKNGCQYGLTNLTDPDEFANHVDNGAFTMALVSKTLQDTNFFLCLFNSTANTTFATQAANVLISRQAEAGISLEYTGMNGAISVKQADVVLNTYPLAYTQNYTAADSFSDLEYYATKQSQDGPGMTYAIFSIVANTVSPSGCAAYTYQQYSTQPYLRGPWFQFSEQLLDDFEINGGFHPAFPFLTGHGGANQVVLYGYLGLRYIPSSWALHINPALPPQIATLRYRTFHYRGWPISAWSNATHTTLTRNGELQPAAGAVPNRTYADAPIPVVVGAIGATNTQTYQLHANSSITVPNRLTAFKLRTAHNAAQCLPVTTDSDFVQGQFPIAAVDGGLSTTWQPAQANKTASISISFPDDKMGQRVVGLGFDFADTPPYNYSVYFSNSSSPARGQLVSSGNISISAPFDISQVEAIVPVSSNHTYINLTTARAGSKQNVQEYYYLSKYATLSIWGSWYDSTCTHQTMWGNGAKVAEFEVITAAGEQQF